MRDATKDGLYEGRVRTNDRLLLRQLRREGAKLDSKLGLRKGEVHQLTTRLRRSQPLQHTLQLFVAQERPTAPVALVRNEQMSKECKKQYTCDTLTKTGSIFGGIHKAHLSQSPPDRHPEFC